MSDKMVEEMLMLRRERGIDDPPMSDKMVEEIARAIYATLHHQMRVTGTDAQELYARAPKQQPPSLSGGWRRCGRRCVRSWTSKIAATAAPQATRIVGGVFGMMTPATQRSGALICRAIGAPHGPKPAPLFVHQEEYSDMVWSLSRPHPSGQATLRCLGASRFGHG
jgi:hypothetical protein